MNGSSDASTVYRTASAAPQFAESSAVTGYMPFVSSAVVPAGTADMLVRSAQVAPVGVMAARLRLNISG